MGRKSGMVSFMIQKKQKFPFIIIASIYAAIAIFGMQTHSIAMEHGIMIKCPFMNESGSVCQTNIPDYVTHWFTIFATILSPFFIAFCVLMVRNRLRSVLRAKEGSLDPPFFKLYSRSKPSSRLFNSFVFIFSKGILHTRIYA